MIAHTARLIIAEIIVFFHASNRFALVIKPVFKGGYRDYRLNGRAYRINALKGAVGKGLCGVFNKSIIVLSDCSRVIGRIIRGAYHLARIDMNGDRRSRRCRTALGLKLFNRSINRILRASLDFFVEGKHNGLSRYRLLCNLA